MFKHVTVYNIMNAEAPKSHKTMHASTKKSAIYYISRWGRTKLARHKISHFHISLDTLKEIRLIDDRRAASMTWSQLIAGLAIN
jgi:SOS response regulatory protein OraA/RecX